MTSLIDWDSPTFGDPATCVHESSVGSWTTCEPEEQS